MKFEDWYSQEQQAGKYKPTIDKSQVGYWGDPNMATVNLGSRYYSLNPQESQQLYQQQGITDPKSLQDYGVGSRSGWVTSYSDLMNNQLQNYNRDTATQDYNKWMEQQTAQNNALADKWRTPLAQAGLVGYSLQDAQAAEQMGSAQAYLASLGADRKTQTPYMQAFQQGQAQGLSPDQISQQYAQQQMVAHPENYPAGPTPTYQSTAPNTASITSDVQSGGQMPSYSQSGFMPVGGAFQPYTDQQNGISPTQPTQPTGGAAGTPTGGAGGYNNPSSGGTVDNNAPSAPQAAGTTLPPTQLQGDAGVVDQLYRDLMGRPADQGGLATWMAALSSKGYDWVKQQLMQSPEYLQRQGAMPFINNLNFSEANVIRRQQAMEAQIKATQDTINNLDKVGSQYNLTDLQKQIGDWNTKAAQLKDQLAGTLTNVANDPYLTMNQIIGSQSHAQQVLGNKVQSVADMASVAQRSYDNALQAIQTDRSNKIDQAKLLLDTYAQQYDLSVKEKAGYQQQLDDYYNKIANQQIAQTKAEQQNFENQIKLQNLELDKQKTNYDINKPYYKASSGSGGGSESASGSYTPKEFWSAASNEVNNLQSGESWGTVWARLASRFPTVDAATIDSALGTQWREAGAYNQYEATKKGVTGNLF